MTNTMKRWIDYNLFSRGRILEKKDGENRYRLADFSGTAQEKDIKDKTSPIDRFYRVKINVKAFSDVERAKKGLPPFDFSDTEAILKVMKDEFDMPYWAFASIAVLLKDLRDTFIYQLKACNIHCPWCYVDDSNKSATSVGGEFFSMKEILDVFEDAQKNSPLYNFRPSGGEPTLAIEQWLECLREIETRGLTAYVQADTNLTTGGFIEYLEQGGLVEKNILDKIGEYSNFGVLCSFKGTDVTSHLRAIGMPPKFDFLEEHRWYSFEKLIRAGIDAYPFIYDPNPETLEAFMDKGAKLFGDGFYLKTWVVPLKLYGPEKERLAKAGIDPVEYQRELTENFTRSEDIMQDLVRDKLGINYKAVPRTGVKLKILGKKTASKQEDKRLSCGRPDCSEKNVKIDSTVSALTHQCPDCVKKRIDNLK